MADDMTDKIQSILNNPEMMGMLSGLLNKGGENTEREEKSEALIPSNDFTPFSLPDIGDDKRVRLLTALKPYMKSRRSADIDKAIKMLKLTKIGSILKDL